MLLGFPQTYLLHPSILCLLHFSSIQYYSLFPLKKHPVPNFIHFLCLVLRVSFPCGPFLEKYLFLKRPLKFHLRRLSFKLPKSELITSLLSIESDWSHLLLFELFWSYLDKFLSVSLYVNSWNSNGSVFLRKTSPCFLPVGTKNHLMVIRSMVLYRFSLLS